MYLIHVNKSLEKQMMTLTAYLTIVCLYSQKGNSMEITSNLVYSHPETGETPV